MARLAILAGSGATFFPQLADAETRAIANHWGAVAGGIATWQQSGHEVVFVARHGGAGDIPPHKVNYRANVQALHDLGVNWVVALNAVGGIATTAVPGRLVIPDQLIDYTSGREHTFHTGEASASAVEFIDFTEPYSNKLRQKMIAAADRAGLECVAEGTYGATQGPRLETAAEITRLERDGCTIVGMTGMPEAALARELGLQYASCSFVVNWAAGRSAVPIHAEIESFLRSGMQQAAALLQALLPEL